MGSRSSGPNSGAINSTARTTGTRQNRPSYLDRRPQWDTTYSTKTDADGRFRIPSAPVGYQPHVTVKTDGYGQGFVLSEAGKPVEVKLPRPGRFA